MTPDEFQAFALSFDGVVSGTHMGQPDFRVDGRIFAALPAGKTRAMVRLSATQQGRWIGRHPDALEPAEGAWGMAGCTLVSLERVSGRIVRELLLDAWQQMRRRVSP